ncbi:MAG: hypothetical protein ACFFCQ_15575, partial [Promethearchaeota archaeon]
MVFQYKRAKSFRSYITVLIVVIIFLSALLIIGTFLGSLSANATRVDEHPVLRELRIDANTTVFDEITMMNRSKCEIFPLEVRLVEKISDLTQSVTGTSSTELTEISDVEGKIQFIYQYPNGTQYGIGEDRNYEDSIWVTDPTKWLENAGVYKWRFLDYQKTFSLASGEQLLDDLVSEGTIEIF